MPSGFTVELPKNWDQDSLSSTFKMVGGKYAFSSPQGTRAGTVNIAVVTEGVTLPKESRKRQLKFFLRYSSFFFLQWSARIEILDRLLDGEANTAWAEATVRGRDDRIRYVRGIAESMHRAIIYTVQYAYDADHAEEVIQILDTLHFSP